MSVKEMILLTAIYYSKTVPDAVLEMYAEDLADLPVDRVLEAYKIYRRNPANKFFPLPAQIREIIAPTVSAKSEARESVERIKQAITKFGYCNLNEARMYIGPVGWKLVQGLGGWTAVCESNFIVNSNLIAQAINRGEDIVNFQGNIMTDNLLGYDEQKKLDWGDQ